MGGNFSAVQTMRRKSVGILERYKSGPQNKVMQSDTKPTEGARERTYVDSEKENFQKPTDILAQESRQLNIV